MALIELFYSVLSLVGSLQMALHPWKNMVLISHGKAVTEQSSIAPTLNMLITLLLQKLLSLTLTLSNIQNSNMHLLV